MSQAISGANGKVQLGPTATEVDADVSGCNLDIEVTTFDTSTTADAGFSDTTAALKKISGSFDFFYNVAKKPTGSSLTLTPGTIINTLTIFIDQVNQPTETFTGKALVTKLSLKSKVTDGWMCTASFDGKGPWTMPS